MYQNIFVNTNKLTRQSKVYLWDDTAGLIVSDYKPYAYKKNPYGKYTSMFGDKLDKVTSGFGYGSDGYFETDVPIATRVLIDCYGDSDEISKNHRVLFLDIETETAGGFPKIDIAQQPITAIALYDYTIKKYICMVLDVSGEVSGYEEDDKVVLTFKTEIELLTEFLDRYKILNPTIISGWNTNGFDMQYLFNRIKKVLGDLFAYRLSPIGIVRRDDNTGKIIIAGVSLLDYLILYKKFTVGVKRLPNYRLDTVAYEELKLKKLKYDGSLGDLLRKDIKKFVEYNINDVFLVVGIDKVNRFIELAMALAHVGHVAYEDFEVSSKLLEGALLTYLRKNNLVAPNKPKEENGIASTYEKEYAEGEEPEEDDAEDDEKGFEGAYVKEPIPGRYDWIFSCDINSLYPSTIMSLNISPETLVGQASKWSTELYAKGNMSNVNIDIFKDEETLRLSIDEFDKYIKDNNLSVASNGALYTQNVDGLLKTILVKWYAERVEFKKLAKKASDEKNKDVEQFYNLRQMVQKILLNSLYGVLGLNSWRFSNLINAEAVTISGQNIIKTTAHFVNNVYNKKVGTENVDYVTYVDTDSNYISAYQLMIKEGIDPKDHVAAKAYTIKAATFFASSINSFYNVMMPKFFNTKTHRIKIAEDVIASCAIWLAKKKYVMHKVYDMEKQKDLDYKLDAKGIDIVRTSFPTKFKELMENIIIGMLTYKPKKDIDNTIIDFKRSMGKLQIVEIAKNAPATYRSKKNPLFVYDTEDRSPFTFIKGTIANGKATLAYNDMLKSIGMGDIIEPIYEGAKMKWVYLKDNPYGLDQIGFKSDGTDPQEILEFIANYIDKDQIFDKELFKKLENLYSALNWEIFNENLAAAEEFFTFED